MIRGVEGLPASSLTGLSWAHREDGQSGAGAPRWNVNVQDPAGNPYTIFFGCNAALHAEKGATTNGFGWCEDTQPSPAATIASAVGQPASTLTITGLAIVFDEGTDETNPPPAGCAQQGAAGGFVYLDNIDVQVNGVDHCWTAANDNSSQSTSTCPDPPAGTAITGTTLGLPVGVGVDATDLGLVSALNLAYSGVPLTSWLLYPNVVY